VSAPLDNATLERLITAAVSAVLAELRAADLQRPGRRLAVLVCNAAEGLEFAAASLGAVAQLGYELDWLVAAGPAGRVSAQRVRELVPEARVREAAEAGCPLETARRVEGVVAATLDRPTAVKVALTAPDTFASRLLFEALRLGKPVALATDALGLEAPEATPQMRQALAEPLGRLEVFGAACGPAVELGAALRPLLAPGAAPAFDQRPLVTAAEVEAADGELLLPSEALVTPLALDRARELGVKLRRRPH
jgi:hypothetical protein